MLAPMSLTDQAKICMSGKPHPSRYINTDQPHPISSPHCNVVKIHRWTAVICWLVDTVCYEVIRYRLSGELHNLQVYQVVMIQGHSYYAELTTERAGFPAAVPDC